MGKGRAMERPTLYLDEDALILKAKEILSRRLQRGPLLNHPTVVKDYLIMHYGAEEDPWRERFCVLFLDNRHYLRTLETMFVGTLNWVSISPREIVRAALSNNAAAVILAHNHPSLDPNPSEDDKRMTYAVRDALALVEVRLLDHIIVAGTTATSMSELGLLY